MALTFARFRLSTTSSKGFLRSTCFLMTCCQECVPILLSIQIGGDSNQLTIEVELQERALVKTSRRASRWG